MSEQRSRLAGPPRSPAEPRGCRSPSADRGSLRAERSGLQPCRRFVSFLLSQTRPREGAVPLPELRPKQQGQPSAGTRRLPGVPSVPVLRSMSSPPFGGSAGTWPGPGQGDSPELSSPPGSPAGCCVGAARACGTEQRGPRPTAAPQGSRLGRSGGRGFALRVMEAARPSGLSRARRCITAPRSLCQLPFWILRVFFTNRGFFAASCYQTGLFGGRGVKQSPVCLPYFTK